MSPVLAHECPDTPRLDLSCKRHVRAGQYMPRGLHSEGALTHAPVEAPCSVLAVDTAEERLCPCKYKSAMLRAGDKQLRVAPWPHQPRGATRLSDQPHRNTFPSGESREGARHGGYAHATPGVRHLPRSIGHGLRAPLPSKSSTRKGMKVCSYVKGDSWASRLRSLNGHIAPHPLVSSW